MPISTGKNSRRYRPAGLIVVYHHHIYQVLTKRPNRMRLLTRRLSLETPPHIWIGVSTET